MHGRYIKNKYAFFHKAVYKFITFTYSYLKVCVQTGIDATTMFIIFWDILIDKQIFFLPQVKRGVIISSKHGIYDLPPELPNNLRPLCPHKKKKKKKKT